MPSTSVSDVLPTPVASRRTTCRPSPARCSATAFALALKPCPSSVKPPFAATSRRLLDQQAITDALPEPTTHLKRQPITPHHHTHLSLKVLQRPLEAEGRHTARNPRTTNGRRLQRRWRATLAYRAWQRRRDRAQSRGVRRRCRRGLPPSEQHGWQSWLRPLH